MGKKAISQAELVEMYTIFTGQPLIAVQTNTATSARIQHANSIVNFIRHAPSMAS